jgi:uncharacterized protein YndB with AHSA1/START domain
VDERHSVELQREIRAPRERVWRLVATAEGLSEWTDGAEFDPAVGGSVRLRFRDAVGVGRVLALDPPQHVSVSFDWEGDPLGRPTVLAFDAIDHGAATHLTLRHVGLPSRRQRDLHEAVWEWWFARLVSAATAAGSREGEHAGATPG